MPGATEEEADERSIRELLSPYHPDTLIHLTNDGETSFSMGVNEETSFARLGDVSHMTVDRYQADVVGSGAAAGPGQPVAGFVLGLPGTPGAVGGVALSNYAHGAEYVRAGRFLPDAYVALG